MELNQRLKHKTTHIWAPGFLTKKTEIHTGENTASSTNGARKSSWVAACGRMQTDPYLSPRTKLNPKIKDMTITLTP